MSCDVPSLELGRVIPVLPGKLSFVLFESEAQVHERGRENGREREREREREFCALRERGAGTQEILENGRERKRESESFVLFESEAQVQVRE